MLDLTTLELILAGPDTSRTVLLELRALAENIFIGCKTRGRGDFYSNPAGAGFGKTLGAARAAERPGSTGTEGT
jgi:hypothetical protein